MDSALRPVVKRLEPIMRRNDPVAFQKTLEHLAHRGQQVPPAQLSPAFTDLAPVLANRPKGFYVRLADLAVSVRYV